MQKVQSMKLTERTSEELMAGEANIKPALGEQEEATEFKLSDYYRQEESGDQLRVQDDDK